MKRLNPRLLLIGALAGVTATLLVLGANAQPSFSSVLYAASALPILIAGLGWGNIAAIVCGRYRLRARRRRHLALLRAR